MNALHKKHARRLSKIGRRHFVFAALSLASFTVVNLWAEDHLNAAAGDTGINTFMQVSRLVSTKTLNPVTGAALYQALRQTDPNFDAHLTTLAQRIAALPNVTIELLAADLDRHRQTVLRSTLNQIVSAWYLGVVGSRTYAYQTALMFNVVDDVLSAPSYVRRGPLYWAVPSRLPTA